MSELVDKNGKEIHTEAHENASGLPNGDAGTENAQPKERAAEFTVEEGYFVVKLPIQNNLYHTLSALAWAEDRIRGIYANAMHARANAGKPLVAPNPLGKLVRNFGNKWKTH